MHSLRGMDRKNKMVQELSELNSKRGKNKTDADIDRINFLSYLLAFYVDEKGEPTIKDIMIEASIFAGAAKSRMKSSFKSAVMVDKVDFKYSGPRTLEKLYDDSNFVHTAFVKIGNAKIQRIRPIFNQWSASFTVVVDENQVTMSQVKKAIEDAGLMCGIGDWRPKYGRFQLEEFKEI